MAHETDLGSGYQFVGMLVRAEVLYADCGRRVDEFLRELNISEIDILSEIRCLEGNAHLV